jgi:hypothetical protein
MDSEAIERQIVDLRHLYLSMGINEEKVNQMEQQLREELTLAGPFHAVVLLRQFETHLRTMRRYNWSPMRSYRDEALEETDEKANELNKPTPKPCGRPGCQNCGAKLRGWTQAVAAATSSANSRVDPKIIAAFNKRMDLIFTQVSSSQAVDDGPPDSSRKHEDAAAQEERRRLTQILASFSSPRSR